MVPSFLMTFALASSDVSTSSPLVCYTSLSEIITISAHIPHNYLCALCHSRHLFTSHFQMLQPFALIFPDTLVSRPSSTPQLQHLIFPTRPLPPSFRRYHNIPSSRLIFDSFTSILPYSNSIQRKSFIMARVKGKGKGSYKTKSKGKRQQCRQSKLSQWLGRSASPELAPDPEDPNEGNRRKNLR
jgi:hypothetical protein